MKILNVLIILICLVLTHSLLFPNSIVKVDNKLKYDKHIAQATAEGEDEEAEGEDEEAEGEDEEAEGEDEEAEGEDEEAKQSIEMVDKTELHKVEVKREVKKTKYLLENIERIKNGDKEILQEMYYYDFEAILIIINEDAAKKKGSFADGISNKPTEKRKAIKSFLGGLFNKDPRIRMSSATIIKELLKNLKNIEIPSQRKDGVKLTDEEKEKLAKRYKRQYYQIILYAHSDTRKCYFLETVQRNKHLSRNREGQQYLENVYQEINKLDLMVVREITLERLKTGSLKPKDFRVINPRIFEALSVKIENEPDYDVPINYLDSRITILVYSLANYDPKVRKQAADMLIAEYYGKDADNQTKNKIDKARDNYLVLDNAFRDYIKKEEEAYKKAQAEKALKEQKERERLEKEKALTEKEKALGEEEEAEEEGLGEEEEAEETEEEGLGEEEEAEEETAEENETEEKTTNDDETDIVQ